MVAGQVTVEETGCRLAVTSDSASATIEPTVVAGQETTVEKIGRRLAAMLAEKGILINSPQCELRRRASDSASATIEATAAAGQYTVEEIIARLAKKDTLITRPNASFDAQRVMMPTSTSRRRLWPIRTLLKKSAAASPPCSPRKVS